MATLTPSTPTGLSPRRLLDVYTAAEATGLTPRTIRRLFDERRVPIVKIGRSVRVWSDDLAAYLETNTHTARKAGAR